MESFGIWREVQDLQHQTQSAGLCLVRWPLLVVNGRPALQHLNTIWSISFTPFTLLLSYFLMG